MTMTIGDPIPKGLPPAPAVVVACFDNEPWRERFCYWDGKRFGPGADDWVGAMCGLQVGDPLPWYRRHAWITRGQLMYWRTVTMAASSVVDELRKAMGG